MKVLFLCGSIEPGKDGVGDYTLNLAINLNHLGHQTILIAVHDKFFIHTKPVTQFENQNKNIQIIRIAATLSWQKKVDFVTTTIHDYNPDWISLQYVPYAFNNRGLPFIIVSKLQQLSKSGRWHIMFHETWVGFTAISPFKHKMIGFAQKQIAKRLIKNTRPALVTTTNVLYQQVLKRAGITAQVLPLFSNIPVAQREQVFIENILKRLDIQNESLGAYSFIGIFGTLYPEANLEKTITHELLEVESQQKRLVFVSIGRVGKHGQEELDRLQHVFGDKVKFLIMGELDAKQVSQVLQLLDKSISCTPGQHAGKSGVFAVMRLHSLPVLFPVFDIIPEYDEVIRKNQLLLMDKPAHEWSVEYITQSFTNLLLAKLNIA